MKLVIFGLTISSSWGNGHATLWRALVSALARRKHTVTFFERDQAYYASARDNWVPPPGVRTLCYSCLDEMHSEVVRELDSADVALFTSYCADGAAIARLMLDSRASIKGFYDLDTPVTLDSTRSGAPVAYLPPEGLSGFDIAFSYTGGRALSEFASRFGAREVAPLYGSADPSAHFPVDPIEKFRGALSYLGTYARDREKSVEVLFLKTASRMPNQQFQIAGAQYPTVTPWQPNVIYTPHVAPPLHPAFFCSSRATINITRGVMAQYGYCPSGRMFEAAACGAPILSDRWEGLESFFKPGKEVLVVSDTDDVVRVLGMSDAELSAVAEAGRERVLAEHTADRRVLQLEGICERLYRRVNPTRNELSAA